MLAKLMATAKRASADQRLALYQLSLALVVDAVEPAVLRSQALRAMAAISLLRRERKEIPEPEILREKELLTGLAKSKPEDPQVRGSAIKGIEVLRITEGASVVAEILADPDDRSIPEVSRNACLALVALSGETALNPIRNVMNETQDAQVFSTAAYCLGKIKSPESIAALVENTKRFPDTGACDFALVDMEAPILSVLQQGDGAALVPAIRATRYLWRDGQAAKFVPLLQELVDSPNASSRRAAAERLVEEAAEKLLAEEKQELQVVLSRAQKHPDLADLCKHIRARLTARLLKPRSPRQSVPTPPP